jgi:cytoskeletal protein CcmA (bactofilin family)
LISRINAGYLLAARTRNEKKPPAIDRDNDRITRLISIGARCARGLLFFRGFHYRSHQSIATRLCRCIEPVCSPSCRMGRGTLRSTADRLRAGRADDQDIPMSRIGRLAARELTQRTADLSTPEPTPPRVVEASRTADLSDSTTSPSAEVTSSNGARRDHEVDIRTLIVGRGVSFAGEISYCDWLVVEGNLQANIEGCNNLTIAQSGEVGGYASAQNVDVRGRFDGDLVALNRLLIRATGHVSGVVSYREVEIERGGQISGEVHMLKHGGIPDRDTRRRRRTHKQRAAATRRMRTTGP